MYKQWVFKSLRVKLWVKIVHIKCISIPRCENYMYGTCNWTDNEISKDNISNVLLKYSAGTV